MTKIKHLSDSYLILFLVIVFTTCILIIICVRYKNVCGYFNRLSGTIANFKTKTKLKETLKRKRTNQKLVKQQINNKQEQKDDIKFEIEGNI